MKALIVLLLTTISGVDSTAGTMFPFLCLLINVLPILVIKKITKNNNNKKKKKKKKHNRCSSSLEFSIHLKIDS